MFRLSRDLVAKLTDTESIPRLPYHAIGRWKKRVSFVPTFECNCHDGFHNENVQLCRKWPESRAELGEDALRRLS